MEISSSSNYVRKFPDPIGNPYDTPPDPAISNKEKHLLKKALRDENSLECRIYSNENHIPIGLEANDTDIRFLRISSMKDKNKTIFVVPLFENTKLKIDTHKDAVYKSLIPHDAYDIIRMNKLREMYDQTEKYLLHLDGETFKERKYVIHYENDGNNKLSYEQIYFVNRYLSSVGITEHPRGGLIHLYVTARNFE